MYDFQGRLPGALRQSRTPVGSAPDIPDGGQDDVIVRPELAKAHAILDAWAGTRYPAIGYAARTQIAAADILLVNKFDLVTQEEVDEIVRQARTYNGTASLLKTARCEVDVSFLFGWRPQ